MIVRKSSVFYLRRKLAYNTKWFIVTNQLKSFGIHKTTNNNYTTYLRAGTVFGEIFMKL